MRIGILTFHRAMNYGAMLQAFALVKKINELGGEAAIIDYRSPILEKESKLLKDNEHINLAKIAFRYIKHRHFLRFMSAYMGLTSKIETEAQLKELNQQYNAFIVGSDQVWNHGCIQGDKAFVLAFVDDASKKYSYAASIGGDVDRAKETVRLYGNELSQFSGISVREKNIVPYMRSVFGDRVRCDIDPVLLLDSNSWRQVMSPRHYQKPYLFMYLVGGENNIRKFANDYAKKHNLAIIDNKSSFQFMKFCSPQDFLSWIYYADTVITNSFHGSAFSALFHKNVYTEFAIKGGYNYRSQQLFESIGITGREIVGAEAPERDTPINYSMVTSRLSKFRESSEQYLIEIIKGSLTLNE